jgi:acetylornithine deacetylase
VALDESVTAARAALEQRVAAVCADDDFLAEHPVRVEWWGGQYASGRTDPDHPLLGRLAAAHAAAGGPDLQRRLRGHGQETFGGPYGSDLRQLVGLGGIPTVQYGPGDTVVAHAADEYVHLDEVRACARTLAVLLLEHCGVA